MVTMSAEESKQVSIQAGHVFQPRTPINTQDLFAGRWEQLTAVADAVGQVGLHVVMYGERGVGKTSLANVVRPVLHVFDTPPEADPDEIDRTRLVVKINTNLNDTFALVWRRAFDEISISEERPVLGFSRIATERHDVRLREAWSLPDELEIDDIRRVLSNLPGAVFIFDEFDRANQPTASQFTDLIKALSDFGTPVTIVLVGVSDTIDGLIEGHASIGRSLVQVHMPRMRRDELLDILARAQEKLQMEFEPGAANRIASMSLGLPHYTHLVGLAAVREACKRSSRVVSLSDVTQAMSGASKQAEQSLITEFTKATRSAHRDALYAQVLLACAITASRDTDDLGFFQPADVVVPLGAILRDRRVEIATFNRHLAEFCDEKRGQVLQRTGQERAFRYRFRNPLLPPHVILSGLSSGMITAEQFEELSPGV